jgi:hypothetical protein
MNRYVIGTMAVLLLLMGIASSVAWGQDAPAGGRGLMGPPPETAEACKGKSEGNPAEITTPRGDTIKAICKQIDGQIVAVPEGGFRSPNGTTPGGTQAAE